MKQKIAILVYGHGSVNEQGAYVTSGKRSPVWDDNSQYFEGKGNRDIGDRIEKGLKDKDIPFISVTVGYQDISLNNRTNIVNSICDAYGYKNCLVVAIHSNGFKVETAHGWEVWTSIGETASDRWATDLMKQMQKEFPKQLYRKDISDGDIDKESEFWILRQSKCAAVLSENFFHTNENECRNILMKEEGRQRIANAHVNMITNFYKS